MSRYLLDTNHLSPDALIAFVALCYDSNLLTRDTNLDAILGLQVEN